MPPQRRRRAVEREEEEEVVEVRKRPTLKGAVARALVRTFGKEAAEHLLNAEREVVLAIRAYWDEQARRLEKASERLKRIEVE